jgi:hypothetical protein
VNIKSIGIDRIAEISHQNQLISIPPNKPDFRRESSTKNWPLAEKLAGNSAENTETLYNEAFCGISSTRRPLRQGNARRSRGVACDLRIGPLKSPRSKQEKITVAVVRSSGATP